MRWIVRKALFSLLLLLGLSRFLSLLRASALLRRAAARWPLLDGPDCLAESLRLLSRDPSRLVAFGVRRRGDRLEAHAWLEDAGSPPADRGDFRRLGAL